MTKTAATITAATIVAMGNAVSNYALLKKNGWSYDHKTHQFVKMSNVFAAPIEEMNAKNMVNTNNAIWCGIGLITGLVINHVYNK